MTSFVLSKRSQSSRVPSNAAQGALSFHKLRTLNFLQELMRPGFGVRQGLNGLGGHWGGRIRAPTDILNNGRADRIESGPTGP